MVPNPSMRSGAAVNQAPAGEAWPRPVRCSTTGIPAASSRECAGRRAIPGVVDVDRVDADQGGLVPGQPGGPGLGEEVRVLGVGRRAEPRVVAGVQQHRRAAHVERGQGADVDAAPLRSRDAHHHGGQAGRPLQRDRREVGAIRVAVVGRVEVGPRVADQADPVDRELGTGGVAAARGFRVRCGVMSGPGSPG